MIWRDPISSPNVAALGFVVSSHSCSVTTARNFSSVGPCILSLSLKLSVTSPHSGFVNWSRFICLSRDHSMYCCTIFNIGPITQPVASSSQWMHCAVCSSSSTLSSSSKLAWSLRIFLITSYICPNDCPGSRNVNLPHSTLLISHCSWLIDDSQSSTPILTPAVSLSTSSSIHFSLTFLVNMLDSCYIFAAGFSLNRKLCNALRARTGWASKLVLPSFAWWRCRVHRWADQTYLPAGSGEKFIFGTLTIGVCVDFVVAQEVGCCKSWMLCWQA